MNSKFANKNIIIIATFIVIFLTVYLLYWQGQVAIQKASSKFYAIGFENTDLKCNNKSFEFFIENNQNKEKTYQISVKVNNKELQSNTSTLLSLEKKKIKPDKKIIEMLCDKNRSFKYEISVKQDKNTQNIYKVINTPKNHE